MHTIKNYDSNQNTNKNERFIKHHMKRMAINKFNSPHLDSVWLIWSVSAKAKNLTLVFPTYKLCRTSHYLRHKF